MDIFGHKDTFQFRPITKVDEKNVRKIIFDILEDYGLKVNTEGVDSDLYNITEHYKDGLFGVIEEKSKRLIVGSFALYPLSEKEVELRKMYIRKSFRGNGLGKWVIDFCEAYAQKSGYERISLETASVLKEAKALYLSKGYEIVPQENHTPRCDVLMKKKLK
jgi:putative acetyltransferase